MRLCTLFKNSLDKCFIFDRAAEFEVEFAQTEHFRAEHRIFQGLWYTEIVEKSSDFELGNKLQLVESPVATDRVEKCFVKRNDPFEFFVNNPPFDGSLFECIKYPGNIDRFWATRRAGLTCNALPNGGGLGGLIDIAVLDQPDQHTGNHVHLIAHRATGGAFSALITIGDFCVSEFFDSSNIGRNFFVVGHGMGKKGEKRGKREEVMILRLPQ